VDYRRRKKVPKYIVERHLPGITAEQLTGAARSARETAHASTAQGVPVTYLRSTFVPEGERCYCLFDGRDADAVRKVNETAGIPFTRITEALHLASEDLG
jgi:hypothetical protein